MDALLLLVLTFDMRYGFFLFFLLTRDGVDWTGMGSVFSNQGVFFLDFGTGPTMVRSFLLRLLHSYALLARSDASGFTASETMGIKD